MVSVTFKTHTNTHPYAYLPLLPLYIKKSLSDSLYPCRSHEASCQTPFGAPLTGLWIRLHKLADEKTLHAEEVANKRTSIPVLQTRFFTPGASMQYPSTDVVFNYQSCANNGGVWHISFGFHFTSSAKATHITVPRTKPSFFRPTSSRSKPIPKRAVYLASNLRHSWDGWR